MIIEFTGFPKIARLSREIIVTEKIDGTNAQILIGDNGEFLTGSRTQWITPEKDNFGFAKWALENKEELLKLGVGRHFGEWWGAGIQRKYGLTEKRFSLFNTKRWRDDTVRPKCCYIVPILYEGIFDLNKVEECLQLLKTKGSQAVPFMNPEGIVVYHIQGNVAFKKTIEKDEEPKSLRSGETVGEVNPLSRLAHNQEIRRINE